MELIVTLIMITRVRASIQRVPFVQFLSQWMWPWQLLLSLKFKVQNIDDWWHIQNREDSVQGFWLFQDIVITDLGFDITSWILHTIPKFELHSCEMVLYNTFIEIWYCIYIENYEFVVGKSVNMYVFLILYFMHYYYVFLRRMRIMDDLESAVLVLHGKVLIEPMLLSLLLDVEDPGVLAFAYWSADLTVTIEPHLPFC